MVIPSLVNAPESKFQFKNSTKLTMYKYSTYYKLMGDLPYISSEQVVGL